MFCYSAPGLISLIACAGKAARIAAEVQKLEQVRIQLIVLIAEQVEVLEDTLAIRLKVGEVSHDQSRRFLIIICFVHKMFIVLHICLGKKALLENGQEQKVDRTSEHHGQRGRQGNKLEV